MRAQHTTWMHTPRLVVSLDRRHIYLGSSLWHVCVRGVWGGIAAGSSCRRGLTLAGKGEPWALGYLSSVLAHAPKHDSALGSDLARLGT